MDRSHVAIALLLLVSGTLVTLHFQGFFEASPREPEPEPTPVVVDLEPEPGGREAVGYVPEDAQSVAPAGGGVDARWADMNTEAIEALEAADYAKAVALFEVCIDAVPDEPVFAANLAEALARWARAEYETDMEAAIEKLARAFELAPDRENLGTLLERWRKVASAEEDFAQDLSEHFKLSYDGDRSDLLNFGYSQILRELEDAYQEFGELFGSFPVEAGRPRIKVVLYRKTKFDEVTGLGDWAGGVFDGTVRIPVEDFQRERQGLQRVLRHELVHAFIDAVGGRSVPGWLNEGLAQRLEWPFLPDRQASATRALDRLAGHELFTLDRLQGSLASWKDKTEIQRAYAQSLAFTAHLEHHYGERVLYEMVAGCKEGKTCEETFRLRTGVELSVVLGDLRSF